MTALVRAARRVEETRSVDVLDRVLRPLGDALVAGGSVAVVGGFFGGHLTEVRKVSTRHPAFEVAGPVNGTANSTANSTA